jgi:hypothetical protein
MWRDNKKRNDGEEGSKIAQNCNTSVMDETLAKYWSPRMYFWSD